MWINVNILNMFYQSRNGRKKLRIKKYEILGDIMNCLLQRLVEHVQAPPASCNKQTSESTWKVASYWMQFQFYYLNEHTLVQPLNSVSSSETHPFKQECSDSRQSTMKWLEPLKSVGGLLTI